VQKPSQVIARQLFIIVQGANTRSETPLKVTLPLVQVVSPEWRLVKEIGSQYVDT
jgi:hypothetical protein